MAVESSATTVWEGDLLEGAGRTTPASGAFPEVAVSWGTRTERPSGRTSPEELIAAAHASCFCMAFSKQLADAGSTPQRLEATATLGFVPGEGITFSRIAVRGHVEGIDQAAFADAARAADEGCPVSGALRGNVDITVEATLANG